MMHACITEKSNDAAQCKHSITRPPDKRAFDYIRMTPMMIRKLQIVNKAFALIKSAVQLFCSHWFDFQLTFKI